jgi:hypothetical protein
MEYIAGYGGGAMREGAGLQRNISVTRWGWVEQGEVEEGEEFECTTGE